MNKEKIKELWTQYINETFQNASTQPPYLFRGPNCATCLYWHLIDEDSLKMVSIYSPKEYEHICHGMEGKIIRLHKEYGQIKDTYNDHMFYGFCKRFPPTWPESDSKTRIGLFSITNVKMPKVLSGYRFPFLPHEEQCGEWKQGEWVKEVLSEKLKSDQNG